MNWGWWIDVLYMKGGMNDGNGMWRLVVKSPMGSGRVGDGSGRRIRGLYLLPFSLIFMSSPLSPSASDYPLRPLNHPVPGCFPFLAVISFHLRGWYEY